MPDDLDNLETFRAIAVSEMKRGRKSLAYWAQELLARMEPIRETNQWNDELEAHYQDLKKTVGEYD